MLESEWLLIPCAGIQWKFNEEEIALFVGAGLRDKLLSVPVELHGATFHYTVSPKGQWMEFGFQFEAAPKNMEYLEIYCELRCLETGNLFKGTRKFGEYQTADSMRFPAVSLSTIESTGYESLTFLGVVDVLCCQYRDNHRLNNNPRVMNLAKMRTFGEIKWSLPTGVAQGNVGGKQKVFSDSFNRDVFCLSYRRVTDNYSRHKHEIGITLLRMPAKIKKMELQYALEVYTKSKMSKPKLVKKWKRKAVALSGWSMTVPLSDELRKRVIVHCRIRVIAAFDWNERNIKEKEWLSVGIL